MSKTVVTLFVCRGKDCEKVWKKVCHGSPGKWLKARAEEAGLPYKLHVVKTECMDNCDGAANVCCVAGGHAGFVAEVDSPGEADRVLAVLRSCVESAHPAGPECHDRAV